MNKKRRAILLALLLLPLSAILAWAFYLRSQAQSVTLDDGTTITLLGLSYGTTHRPPLRGWRDLPQLLPESLRRKLNLPISTTLQRTNPVPVAWFEWTLNPGTAHYRVQDLTDIQSEAAIRHTSSTAGQPTLHAVELSAFPRRDPNFLIVASPNEMLSPLNTRFATFTVRNPAVDEYPRWQADPLPALRHDGEMTFELLSFQLATNTSQVRAEFRVLDHGLLTTNWKIHKIFTSDPTGNDIRCRTWRSFIDDGRVALVYRWPLFDDDVWKIRVQFSRQAYATFSSNELWTPPPISIPAALGDVPIASLSNAMPASILTLRSLKRHPESLRLSVGVSPPRNDHYLDILKATDETGRDLETQRISWSDDRSSFLIELPRGEPLNPKTLQLTFAFHPSRFVEYLVQPTLTTAIPE